MLDRIENAFKDLISGLQTARLYPDWHPEFKKSIDKAYASLRDVLRNKEGLIIGIIGEELAYEKEIFFDLSKTVRPAILYLKERGIERIEFCKGLKLEELSKFIAFLTTQKENLKHEAQEELTLLGVKNILVGKIKAAGGASTLEEKAHTAEAAQKAVGYLSAYEDSLGKVSESIEKMLNNEEIDHFILRLTVGNVLDNLVGRYQEFLNFATVKRYDLRTFCHIINVSILSMFFCSKMGFTKEEVLDIGIAGLFHDIGKLYISRKILQKPAKLTEEEFANIKSHVIIGAELLLKYVDVLGVLPVVICFEHHLRFNLSGYPKISYYQKPHNASLIVTICDVYDALSQRRNYKNDYPPKMIYDLMMKEKGTTFEPQLLDNFFRVMGVWPVGTIVSLSNGRVAVVRENNEDDIFSPKVETIDAKGKRELMDLRGAEGKNRIEHSLNPLTEGKEFLPFI